MKEEEYQKTMHLVLDSLFFALKINNLLLRSKNNRLVRIGCKSWRRHWRRVKKAIDLGITEFAIPPDAVLECEEE